MFVAQIKIMPKTELLDPAGKAVLTSLQNHFHQNQTQDVRVGKWIEVKIEANSLEEAQRIAQEAAEKLIVNQVMEDFTLTVEAI